jgi:hypothetical protein
MAKDFIINSTTINYVTKADWEDGAADPGLDGYTSLTRWRRHVWRAPEGMPAIEFDTLFALEGQKVNVVTTDYDNRNSDYKTYYGADLKRVSGRHTGPIMVDVSLEFLVRVT